MSLQRLNLTITSWLPLFAAPIFGVTVGVTHDDFSHVERYIGFLISFFSASIGVSIVTRYIQGSFSERDKERRYTARDLLYLLLLIVALIIFMAALLYLHRRLERLPFILLLIALAAAAVKQWLQHKNRLLQEFISAVIFSFTAAFLTFYLLLLRWHWQATLLGAAIAMLYLSLIIPRVILNRASYQALINFDSPKRELAAHHLPIVQILLPLLSMVIVTAFAISHVLPGRYVFAIMAGALTPKLRSAWEIAALRISRREEPSKAELATLISLQLGTITLFIFLLSLAGTSIF